MEQLQSQQQPLAYYRTSCWKPAVLLPLGNPACIQKICAASRIAEYNSSGKWYQDTGVQLGKASLEHLPVPVCALAKMKDHVDAQSTRLFQLALYRPAPVPAHVVRQYVTTGSLPHLLCCVKLDDILLRNSGLHSLVFPPISLQSRGECTPAHSV